MCRSIFCSLAVMVQASRPQEGRLVLRRNGRPRCCWRRWWWWRRRHRSLRIRWWGCKGRERKETCSVPRKEGQKWVYVLHRNLSENILSVFLCPLCRLDFLTQAGRMVYKNASTSFILKIILSGLLLQTKELLSSPHWKSIIQWIKRWCFDSFWQAKMFERMSYRKTYHFVLLQGISLFRQLLAWWLIFFHKMKFFLADLTWILSWNWIFSSMQHSANNEWLSRQ